jgi:hypothetical protein
MQVCSQSPASELALRVAMGPSTWSAGWPMGTSLENYASVYQQQLYGQFEIVVDGDQLRMEAGPGRKPGELPFDSLNTFMLDWGGATLCPRPPGSDSTPADVSRHTTGFLDGPGSNTTTGSQPVLVNRLPLEASALSARTGRARLRWCRCPANFTFRWRDLALPMRTVRCRLPTGSLALMIPRRICWRSWKRVSPEIP